MAGCSISAKPRPEMHGRQWWDGMSTVLNRVNMLDKQYQQAIMTIKSDELQPQFYEQASILKSHNTLPHGSRYDLLLDI